VSLMSSSGVPVEEIARLAGHSNTRTTEVVYRRELRPVLTTGAEAMDRLFRSPSARKANTHRCPQESWPRRFAASPHARQPRSITSDGAAVRYRCVSLGLSPRD
jgi:hypothetical protein